MSYKQKFGLSRDTSKENYEKNFPGSRVKYEDTIGPFDDNIVAANNKKSDIDLSYYDIENKNSDYNKQAEKKKKKDFTLTSSHLNTAINVGSFIAKGAGGIIMSMLGATNAYGGQANPHQSFDKLIELDEKKHRDKAIQGMTKEEINMYDYKQKMKKLPGKSGPRPYYRS